MSLAGLGNDSDLSDDGMSTADELEEREDFLDPKDTLTTEGKRDGGRSEEGNEGGWAEGREGGKEGRREEGS